MILGMSENNALLAGLGIFAVFWVIRQSGEVVTVGEQTVVTTSKPDPKTTVSIEDAARMIDFQLDGKHPQISQPLILAMIETESNFRRYAVGAAGERGILQIMPGTWEDVINRARLKPEREGQTELDPFDPRDGIRVAIAFLVLILNEIKQKTGKEATIEQMLTAYNVGVTGMLNGKTNTVYVAKIRNATQKYVDLKKSEGAYRLPTSVNSIQEI